MTKLKTPLATALAAGLLATPAATAVAQADLVEPARVTGTTTFPEDVVAGSRAWIDGATRDSMGSTPPPTAMTATTGRR